MSYYILPKYANSETINIEIELSHDSTVNTLVNPSLIFYLNNILLQLNNPDFLLKFIKLNSIISPYKYIYSKTPIYNIPVSKLSLSPTSYIYIELIQLCNLLDNFSDVSVSLSCININNFTIIDAINILRENNEDVHYNFTDLSTNLTTPNYAKFINIDLSNTFTSFNEYIISLINSICYIFKNQKYGGSSIIKIDNLFYKPVIDILFILNTAYEKIYIVKPNASSIVKNDLYIVCKNFICIPNIEKLHDLTISIDDSSIISSLISDDIPYYFLNKIEEANIIIYHQKIQYIDQINNIIINKQKFDNIKKSNIQKCVLWCEKYKIPHNKITDKVNIFLHPVVEVLDETDEETDPIEINSLLNPASLDFSTFSKQYELLKIFNMDD
jgi:hypothetical protein